MSAFSVDVSFWSGRRVFVTGHTGFKGAWLVHFLTHLGAKVGGYALPPEGERHAYGALDLGSECDSSFGDIRDSVALSKALKAFKPEIVFHLAAQAIVLSSYRAPIDTFETNVMGTAHLLESCRSVSSVRAVVVVTSDKCYLNHNASWVFREDDPLGAEDPYSASKACAEIVTAAYRASFYGGEGAAVVASARAGNVFGGGDWSVFRLVPDTMRAFDAGAILQIRNPEALRPWQFVLEAVSGYLMLARACVEQGATFGRAWNFGPEAGDARHVHELVDAISGCWGEGAHWISAKDPNAPHEDSILLLDSSQAKRDLSWFPRLSFQDAIRWTVEWYRAQLRGEDSDHMRQMTSEQIDRFLSIETAA